jgi:prepilin-type N-terminal cleavage/methylation domain-containing protein
MKITHQKAKGFTLVELLVVIAIIAVLAALSTPVIMTALVKARVVSAKAICVSLGNAVDQFESEYSYLPYAPGNDNPTEGTEIRTEDGIMLVLAGVEDEVNTKQIKIFKLGSPKGGASNPKDGMLVTTSPPSAKLYDVWGQPYYMQLDYDLDGVVTGPDGKDYNGKLALVWSSGPDEKIPTESLAGKWKNIPTNFK